MNYECRPRWARYGVAAGCVALGWLAREALTPAFGTTALPFIFLFPAVAIAAWFGGLGAGVLATILSAAAADWFFIEAVHSWSINNPGDIAGIGAFLVSCAFIVGATKAMHRAITISSRDEAGRLCVDVSDTGCGIEPPNLERIFEPFTDENRAKSSNGGQRGGLGLGLAIARQIIIAHSGTLVATSEGVNRGATFTVSLPVPHEETELPPVLDKRLSTRAQILPTAQI